MHFTCVLKVNNIARLLYEKVLQCHMISYQSLLFSEISLKLMLTDGAKKVTKGDKIDYSSEITLYEKDFLYTCKMLS